MLTVIRRILSYTKPCRKELFGMLFFALIGTGLSLFVPILIGKAVDCVVAAHEVNFPQLWKIILVLALTIAVSAVFQWLMSLCTNRLAAHTIRDLRCDLFTHLQHVPLRCTRWGWKKRRRQCRISSPADSSSVSPLHGRWRQSLPFFWQMNPRETWTARPVWM